MPRRSRAPRVEPLNPDELAQALTNCDVAADALGWHALLSGDPIAPAAVRQYRRELKVRTAAWYAAGRPPIEDDRAPY